MKFEGKEINRNGKLIRSYLSIKKNVYVTSKNIRIIFPSRYLQIGLCNVSDSITIVGILMLLDDKGNYGVLNIPTFIKIPNTTVREILWDGIEYSVLEYEAGDVVIENKDCIVTESTLYPLFNNFFTLAKVAKFLDYEDLSNIFIKSGKYCGSRIGKNPLGLEMISSVIAKDPKDFMREYRFLNSDKTKPVFKGLANINYTITNSLSKITGAYTKAGITSAVVSDNDTEASKVERILRA